MLVGVGGWGEGVKGLKNGLTVENLIFHDPRHFGSKFHDFLEK